MEPPIPTYLKSHGVLYTETTGLILLLLRERAYTIDELLFTLKAQIGIWCTTARVKVILNRLLQARVIAQCDEYYLNVAHNVIITADQETTSYHDPRVTQLAQELAGTEAISTTLLIRTTKP